MGGSRAGAKEEGCGPAGVRSGSGARSRPKDGRPVRARAHTKTKAAKTRRDCERCCARGGVGTGGAGRREQDQESKEEHETRTPFRSEEEESKGIIRLVSKCL